MPSPVIPNPELIPSRDAHPPSARYPELPNEFLPTLPSDRTHPFARLAQHPSTRVCMLAMFVLLLALAEWEQPGYLPTVKRLPTILVTLFGAGCMILGALALEHRYEMRTWPWNAVNCWDAWIWDEGEAAGSEDSGPLQPQEEQVTDMELLATTPSSGHPNPHTVPALTLKRFNGEGFHKHNEKIAAVAELTMPGGRRLLDSGAS
ncbi:hypothetical protein P153DRAFT_427484 [Dothidotthia symphoricarpi CBS 119687]|uniref:Uncharacterized protein n=1 Tax=Dothidotthia symphoricarpi CBS 119687 TaxID=1392245 RepID=A0A6A6AUI6_9PLEO|nr:uncharacterized protein P153DRAFT_427484 [Dothidotthia symphoricarpi CBS 119687]KAF2134868.1 hypothetical protein P153DRAFT_427484 [Dothidotthia symphoricarpi CBS 119687]